MTRSFSDLALHALSNITPLVDRIAINKLATAESLPSSVQGFVEMEMEIRIRKDLALIEDEKAVERTRKHVLESGSLDRTDAIRLLETAYKYAAGYLIEPQRFLLELLTQGEDVTPLDHYFFHALSYIREYTYFQELLPMWARALSRPDVSREQLKSKLSEIDRSVTGVLSPDHVGLLLTPLFELFEGTQIEKEVFLRFFSDKGAFGAFDSLREDLRYHYSLENIVDLIRKAIADQTPKFETTGSVGGADYTNFLDELKQAGIVIGAPGAEAWLLEIEQRHALTGSSRQN